MVVKLVVKHKYALKWEGKFYRLTPKKLCLGVIWERGGGELKNSKISERVT